MRFLSKISSLLTLGVFIRSGEVRAQVSPFGSDPSRLRRVAGQEKPIKTVVIAVGHGVLLSPEHAQVVSGLWDQMKATHSFSEDGEIVPGLSGAPLTSDPDVIAAFYRYVAANQVSRALTISERCAVCKGSGVIYVYPDDIAKRISPTRTDCEYCEADGQVPVDVVYKLACAADKLPPRSKSPRQKKQEALESLAKSGNVEARLKLAEQFKSGAPLVTRDIDKASDAYATLACEGVLEGLAGFLDIARSQDGKESPKEFLVALEAAVAALGRKESKYLGSAGADSSYLEQIRVRLLADKLTTSFAAKKLQKHHLDYRGLVNALEADERRAVEAVVVQWMKRGPSARFDMELLAKLIKAAQKSDSMAFAVLGVVTEQGLHDLPNPQAAHIFFSIAKHISRDPGYDGHIRRVSAHADIKVSEEILDEFSRISTADACPPTLIASILKIKNGK